MKSPMKTLTILATGVLLLSAGTAKAEMSQGAKQTLTACAYMGGVLGAGAYVMEQGTLKYAAIGCGGAAAAVGAYNYLVIPTEAAEAPKEADLKQDESSGQVNE